MSRTQLTPEQAIAMLPDGDYIHTFTCPAVNVLCGAYWKREDILARINDTEKQPCELAGKHAVKANHALCFWDRVCYVFVATKPSTDNKA